MTIDNGLFVYELVDGEETVFIGSSNCAEKTLQSHIASGLPFTEFNIISFGLNEKEAEAFLSMRLLCYCKKFGNFPLFNDGIQVKKSF